MDELENLRLSVETNSHIHQLITYLQKELAETEKKLDELDERISVLFNREDPHG
jgi:hypothetical protein